MSMTPVSRKPNWAGSAPVMSEILSAKFRPKTGDAFRQEHVVDAVLQIRVLAADMKLAKRILGHSGKAQNRLVELGVLSLRLRIKAIRSDRITSRPKARHNLLPRDIEFLRTDDDVFSRGRRWSCRS